MSTPKLCLSTLDPRVGGGVKSVSEFAYSSAIKFDYDPYLVYNALDWEYCLPTRKLLAGQWSIPVFRETIDGMQGRRIGRVLPEIEVGNYVFNYRQWSKELKEGELFLGIGGPCLSALPLALSEHDFGCWIGTTIEDERETQKRQYTLPQRVRYEVTRPILKRYERYVLNEAKLVIVQSEYTKQRIVEKHGLDPDEIDRLPVPIDTTRFKPPECETSNDECVVLFVGRFNDPRKNIELLFRAFSRVVQDRPRSRLVLVGDQLRESDEKLLHSLGISESVECKGEVQNIVPVLQQADVFALPSRQEGLCIAGLEAMSCGVPVVSTRCGGPEEYVVDGETGYLVPVGDANTFADRLTTILNEDDRRESMANSARELVIESYNCGLVSEKFRKKLEVLWKETDRKS